MAAQTKQSKVRGGARRSKAPEDRFFRHIVSSMANGVLAVRRDGTLPARVRGFFTYEHLEGSATSPHVVFDSWWSMRYIENPGAAWGLFRELSDGVRNGFFVSVSLLAALFILGYYRKLREEQRYLQVALGLLLSGAMGNFADRLARRYVIDFIDWHAGSWHWPTFNLADSMIVVGVTLLLLHPGSKKAAAGADVPRLERSRS